MENNWILFAIQFGMGVIGFIFLGTAIGLDISLKRKKKKCTQLVPAVIVDIERVSYTSTDEIVFKREPLPVLLTRTFILDKR